MEAGIVSYKLCDLRYECEKCSFDQLLRKNASESLGRQTQPPKTKDPQTMLKNTKAAKTPPEDPETTDFDHLFQSFYNFNVKEDLYYHPGHTWMNVEEAQSVRIGLDAFVMKLVPEIKTVILPSAKDRIDRGYVCGWIVERDGTLPITAPISGSVIANNRHVSKEPSLLAKSPYGQGWLMKIEPEGLKRDLKHLYRMDDMLAKCIDDIETLREALETLLKQNREKLGPTLCDGGKSPVHIRDSIGSRRYFNIINSLLTGKHHRIRK